VKLLNTRHNKVLLTYIDDREKKTVRVMPKEIIELNDSVYFLSKKAFSEGWLTELGLKIVSSPAVELSEEDKMQKAKRDVEQYINTTK